MKILSTYHVTATKRKHLKHLVENNILSGRIGRTDYHLTKEGDTYTAKITEMGRGIIPCGGSPLRPMTEAVRFTL